MSNNLRARLQSLGHDFSQQQIETYLKTAEMMVGKPVLTHVIDALAPYKSHRRFNYVERELRKLMPKLPGYLALELGNIDGLGAGWSINVSLSRVPKGYFTDITVPPGHDKDLVDKMLALKEMANAYWTTFQESHKSLFETIQEVGANIAFDRLQIAPANETVMFFSPNSEQYIGLICYWVDPNGNVKFLDREK